jgi:hypothetical protein
VLTTNELMSEKEINDKSIKIQILTPNMKKILRTFSGLYVGTLNIVISLRVE